jgi:hypothetical protein
MDWIDTEGRGGPKKRPVGRIDGEDGSLPLPFEPEKLVRSSDPDTSKAAALSAGELRSRHHGIIMDCILEYGPLTSEQVSGRTELTHAQAWRRMGELRDKGLLVETPIRRPNVSGRMAIVWGLPDQVGWK